ncbi:MAG: hypothetical protein ACRDF4_04145 [Rhabdochlamydiaceae bacterium]
MLLFYLLFASFVIVVIVPPIFGWTCDHLDRGLDRLEEDLDDEEDE